MFYSFYLSILPHFVDFFKRLSYKQFAAFVSYCFACNILRNSFKNRPSGAIFLSGVMLAYGHPTKNLLIPISFFYGYTIIIQLFPLYCQYFLSLFFRFFLFCKGIKKRCKTFQFCTSFFLISNLYIAIRIETSASESAATPSHAPITPLYATHRIHDGSVM